MNLLLGCLFLLVIALTVVLSLYPTINSFNYSDLDEATLQIIWDKYTPPETTPPTSRPSTGTPTSAPVVATPARVYLFANTQENNGTLGNRDATNQVCIDIYNTNATVRTACTNGDAPTHMMISYYQTSEELARLHPRHRARVDDQGVRRKCDGEHLDTAVEGKI